VNFSFNQSILVTILSLSGMAVSACEVKAAHSTLQITRNVKLNISDTDCALLDKNQLSIRIDSSSGILFDQRLAVAWASVFLVDTKTNVASDSRTKVTQAQNNTLDQNVAKEIELLAIQDALGKLKFQTHIAEIQAYLKK
jgi:hypothetical protein